MSKIIVPLERRFSPVAKDQDAADSSDYLELWGYGKPIGWPEIDARHCTIIRGLRRNGTENLHKEWPGPEIHFWRSGTAAKLGSPERQLLRVKSR